MSLYISGKEIMANKTAVVYVAASTATNTEKTLADFVCLGANDDVTINAALATLPANGGICQLSSGSFITGAPITVPTGCILRGSGRSVTRILPNAFTFAAVTITGLVLEWALLDFTIDYGSQANNAAAIGISVISSGGNYPYLFAIEKVSIYYAYRGFHTTAISFMYALRDVYVYHPYDLGISIQPAGATTIALENVYVNGDGIRGRGYDIRNIDALTIINCAADNLVPGNGVNVALLQTCRATISGFFFEQNTLNDGSALLFLSGVNGLVTGYKSVNNAYNATPGQESYGLRAGTSIITVIAPLSTLETRANGGAAYSLIASAGNLLLFLIGDSITVPAGVGGTAFGVYNVNNLITRLDNASNLLLQAQLTALGVQFTDAVANPAVAGLLQRNGTDILFYGSIARKLTGGHAKYGDLSDGNVTIAVNTNLGRDMFYNILTVNAGVTLNTNGYRVFARRIINSGVISNDGGAGGNGGFASGGAAGAAAAAGSLGGGYAGGVGVTGAVNGTNGNSATNTLGGASGTGGVEGGGVFTPGNQGTVTAPIAGAGGFREIWNALRAIAIDSSGNVLPLRGGAGGPSGGCWTGNPNNASGGGGGGGGIVLICAEYIDNSAGVIRAKGGASGNSTGQTGASGAGGGGVVILIYDTLVAGTEQATGGATGGSWNGYNSNPGSGTVIKIPNA